MTSRFENLPTILTQENRNLRLNKKATDVTNRDTSLRRPALGDVGNKLHIQNTNSNVCEKPGAMGPPTALPKKLEKKENAIKKPVIKADAIKKDVLPKKPETTKTLKREESLLKITQKIEKEPPSYSTQQLAIIDPDASTKNEPQMVTEYLADIFEYLRELECRFPIKEGFLDDHRTTAKMRSILVNWLVEVHLNFKLCLETLHLCIAIVDRYLQVNKHVGRDTLQLVGTSALLLASKYEEIYIPELEDFVYICDDTFSKKQILHMEMEILAKIEFNMGRPLSIHFLRRYSKIADVKNEHHTLGKYLLELALVEYSMSHVRPSIQAAAACCLSMAVLNDAMDPAKVWTPTLIHYTTHKYVDFKATLVDLAMIVVKAETSKYQTVKKKYAAAKYSKISLHHKLNGALIKKLTST